MASLTGFDAAERAINKALRTALSGDVRKFVMKDLNFRLNAQEQPDGSAFPEKAESTKKAYRSRGWNTEKFLVRTGKSVKLSYSIDKRGDSTVLRITPVGWETLAYHVPSRVEWFPDYSTGAARDVIVKIFNDAVRSELG